MITTIKADGKINITFWLTTLLTGLPCGLLFNIKQIKLMDPRPYTYQFRKPRLSNPTYQSDHLYESIYHINAYGKMFPNMDKIPNGPASSEIARGFVINPFKQDRQKMERVKQEIRNIDPYIQNKANLEPRGYIPPAVNREQVRSVERHSTNSSASIENSQPDKNRGQNATYQQNRAKLADYQQNIKRSNSFDNRRHADPIQYGGESQKRLQEPMSMSGYGSKLLLPSPRRGDQDAIFQRQQKPYNIINCYPREVMNTHRAYPKYTLENKLIETGQYPYFIPNPERT